MSFSLLLSTLVTFISIAATIKHYFCYKETKKLGGSKTAGQFNMSLKQIILSPETLTQLYTTPIIELSSTTKTTTAASEPAGIKFLGSNKKNITILVKTDDAPFLNDKLFNFLAGILNACKLNMADVALINILSQNKIDYSVINNITAPEQTILFDINSQEIALPLQFPHFQVQRFNSVMYLSAPSLSVVESDKAVKAQLWASLKQLFQL